MGCASSQSIGKDKYYHFAAGATAEVVANEMSLPVGTSFIAGFAKETYDYLRYGGFDAKDLVATTLGGIIINYIIKKRMKEKIKKFVDKIQEAWNKLLYKLMFKKYK